MPTLSPGQIATQELAKIVPWLNDPQDPAHELAAEALVSLWLTDVELGKTAASPVWVVDGIGLTEAQILAVLLELAKHDRKVAKRVSEYSWLQDDGDSRDRTKLESLAAIASYDTDVAARVTKLGWVAHETGRGESEDLALAVFRWSVRAQPVRANETLRTEWFQLGPAYYGEDHFIAAAMSYETYPDAGPFLGNLPWLSQHDLGEYDVGVLSILEQISIRDRELAKTLAGYEWVVDGVNLRGYRALSLIEQGTQISFRLGRDMAEIVENRVREEELESLRNMLK